MIGVTDNFFESGAHSLKITRLASQIYKEFGVRIQLKDVFASPTIETVSDIIKASKWIESSRNVTKENKNSVEV
jgi:acyl carrier protein